MEVIPPKVALEEPFETKMFGLENPIAEPVPEIVALALTIEEDPKDNFELLEVEIPGLAVKIKIVIKNIKRSMFFNFSHNLGALSGKLI